MASVLALAAAFLFALAATLQQKGALSLPTISLKEPGSLLRLGGAKVVVTAKPHNGCAKFHARFGADALRFVSAKPTRNQNLRGIYWKVVEPGEIFAGASIQVLSRP